MLNKKTIIAVEPLVEGFVRRNQAVLPHPGTPMAALCSTMSLGRGVPEDLDGLVQLSAETIVVSEPVPEAEVTLNPAEAVEGEIPQRDREVNVHDEILQTAVQDVVGKIVDAKVLAREKVLPACRALYPELEERVDDLILAPKLIPTVVLSYYPEWYLSPGFLALMEGENLSGYIEGQGDYAQSINLAVIPGDVLRTLLFTGNEDTDKYILSAVDGVTDAALEDIYNHFFRGSRLSVLKDEFCFGTDGYAGFIGGRVSAAPALFCYLWSVALMDDIQEGNNMNIDNYRARMAKARQVAINGMARVARDRLQKIDNGELVLQAPTGHQIQRAEDATQLNIVVNADNYVTYLKEGGSPEALTAAVLLDRSNIAKDELLGNAEGYLIHYRNYLNMKSSQQQANRLRAYGLALRGIFADKIIPDLDEDAREAVQQAVFAATANLTNTEVANFQQFFRTLYVAAVYPQEAVTVNRLIDEIDTTMRERPELTVFEAAAIATMNMTTDYVAQQFYVLEV